MIKVASLLFGILLCGCATNMPRPKPQEAATVATGKAVIYVFNTTAAVFGDIVPVLFEDRDICALRVRTYTKVECVPGTYKVATAKSPSIKLSVASGEVVYLKFTIEPAPRHRGILGHAARPSALPNPLTRMDAQEAKQLMQSFDAIGNTFSKR